MQQIATREDVRRALGNRIVCGIPGTGFDAEAKEILREIQPLGLILFSHNIESPEQVCELNAEIKAWQKEKPLLICVDQEGGRVARIRAPATVWPSAEKLGTIGDPSLTRNIGRALGQELRAMNFDLTFAPVLDINTNPDNPVIGDRAFASSPEQTAEQAIAFAQGLASAQVASCGKHFPGHGDTLLDSHFDLPYVEHELERLREVEWRPFKEACAAGFEAMMSAHLVISCLDPQHPATLSQPVMDHLRTEIGFEGVIFSDDLDMKALADNYSAKEIAHLGTQAGIDCFLACKNASFLFDFFRELIHIVEEEKITHVDLLKSEKKLTRFRDKHIHPVQSWSTAKTIVACSEHKNLSQEAEARYQANV